MVSELQGSIDRRRIVGSIGSVLKQPHIEALRQRQRDALTLVTALKTSHIEEAVSDVPGIYHIKEHL